MTRIPTTFEGDILRKYSVRFIALAGLLVLESSVTKKLSGCSGVKLVEPGVSLSGR